MIRLLFAIFVLTQMVACAPRHSDLPADQARFTAAEVLWDSQDIEDYRITVNTSEFFGPRQTVAVTCTYVVTIEHGAAPATDLECDDGVAAQDLEFHRRTDRSVSGLFAEARGYEASLHSGVSGYREFDVSFDSTYGFPSRIEFFVDEDGVYRIVIVVEQFVVLERANQIFAPPGMYCQGSAMPTA